MTQTGKAIATRVLGQTGVLLSTLGFGGAAIGELYAPVPPEDAAEAIEEAWQTGIRYFDTAPWYGVGLSELRLGAALRSHPRPDFVLSTKVGRVLRAPPVAERGRPSGLPWAGGLNFRVRFDYTYDGVMRSLEDSLQRLGLEYVDLLLIHDLDRGHFPDDKIFSGHMRDLSSSGYRALEELKAGGVIRGVGAGINRTGAMSELLDTLALDFFLVATCYTLLDHTAWSEMQRAIGLGMGFVIGAPFNGGIGATGPVKGAKFNYRDAGPEALEHAGKVEAVCRDHGVRLAAASLQFVLGPPEVASVIPGVITRRQASANLSLISDEIPAGLWSDLRTAALISTDVPVPAPR